MIKYFFASHQRGRKQGSAMKAARDSNEPLDDPHRTESSVRAEDREEERQCEREGGVHC